MNSKRRPTTHSFPIRPALNPSFTYNSPHNESNSGSSRQQSSNGYPSSSLGLDDRSETGSSILPRAPINYDGVMTTTSSVAPQRKTTRDLIGIFEGKTPSSLLPLASHSLHRARRREKPLHSNPHPSLLKSNPLRESLRNLLTVFNKAKKTFRDHTAEVKGTQSGSSIDNQVVGHSNGGTETEDPEAPKPISATVTRRLPGLSVRSPVRTHTLDATNRG